MRHDGLVLGELGGLLEGEVHVYSAALDDPPDRASVGCGSRRPGSGCGRRQLE
jgi:hypothetical protein